MRIFTATLAAGAIALAGCAQTGTTAASPSRTTPTAAATTAPLPEKPAQLPLPQIPAHITVPEQRAAYIVTHFWDSMDFADTTLSHDTAFIEQNFANFASLFPLIDTRTTLSGAAVALMKKAEANRTAYNLLAETADKYLYDPESPMLSEEAYIPFLEAITGSPFIDNALRARYTAQLEDACKNRQGTTAVDFDMITRAGKKTTLLKECAGATAVILMFYDPECDNCSRIISHMDNDGALHAALTSGRVRIIAVYPDGDEDMYATAAGKIPGKWIDAINPGGKITEQELYSLRAMPSIYLLDVKGTVIIKGADAAGAIAAALAM